MRRRSSSTRSSSAGTRPLLEGDGTHGYFKDGKDGGCSSSPLSGTSRSRAGICGQTAFFGGQVAV